MCYCCCPGDNPPPLPEPAIPTVTAITPTGFTVNWTAVAGADGYVVRVCQVGTMICTTSDVQTGTSYAVTGLDPAVQYDVSIQAQDSTGEHGPSPWSPAASATTLALAAPAGLAVTGTPTDTSIDVSWTAVPGAASYMVRYKTGAAIYTEVAVPAGTTASLTGLVPGAEYQIGVKAIATNTPTGDSPYSTDITVTTGNLPVPTGLAVQGTPTATQIEVAWTAVPGAVSYVVRYKTGADAYTELPVPSGTTASLTGLTAASDYLIGVKAVSATSPAGDSPYSADITGTTAAA